jgi:serine/threonine protein kinase
MLKGIDLALRLPARAALAALATAPGSMASSQGGRETARVRAMPGREAELPELVAGRWKRLAPLGQGGHGWVWAGQCLKTGAPVALKFARQPEHERLLRREAALLRALSPQPFVARLLALHAQEGMACLVLSRSGPSLADWRRTQPGRRLAPADAARLGLQMLEAVRAVHRHGYVHGDVKNANCLVTSSIDGPLCSLIDFGLARPAQGLSATVPSLIGTARYASVAVHGGQRPRAIDDLWSWYYSVAELFAGDLPWHRLTDLTELMTRKQASRGGPLLQSLPRALQAVEAALSDAETGELPEDLLRQALRAAGSHTGES